LCIAITGFFLPVEPVEEVIAEDYDDRHEPRLSADVLPASKTEELPPPADDAGFVDLDEIDELIHEVILCPNRFNPYHSCVDYCRQRWGCKRFKPDPAMASRRERLLRRYPLPPGWLEVGDPET
jgi:hypothetical protein